MPRRYRLASERVEILVADNISTVVIATLTPHAGIALTLKEARDLQRTLRTALSRQAVSAAKSAWRDRDVRVVDVPRLSEHTR